MPAALVFNDTEDAAEVLCAALRGVGWSAFAAAPADVVNGRLDLVGLLQQHDPDVVICDVPHPYEPYWVLLRLFASSHAMDGRPIVVTTTNAPRVRELAASGEVRDVVEVFGVPYDPDVLLATVHAALAVRARRRQATASCAACGEPIGDDEQLVFDAGRLVHVRCTGRDETERVAAFLRRRAGEWFCVRCLSSHLALRGTVTHKAIARLRVLPGFQVRSAPCATCDMSRPCICAIRLRD